MKNLTLSTKADPKEDEALFLLALVFNFLPTLGAMTEKTKTKTTKTKGRLHQNGLETR